LDRDRAAAGRAVGRVRRRRGGGPTASRPLRDAHARAHRVARCRADSRRGDRARACRVDDVGPRISLGFGVVRPRAGDQQRHRDVDRRPVRPAGSGRSGAGLPGLQPGWRAPHRAGRGWCRDAARCRVRRSRGCPRQRSELFHLGFQYRRLAAGGPGRVAGRRGRDVYGGRRAGLVGCAGRPRARAGHRHR